ncbi:hypothetical protein CVT91_04355 [Candidatus Atribacteria bacterium HGW-Atribacteria-1]|nr:MAG: hypothetical protein CVT91_04355 [Candidatus Atribacteria bacterium HGW-Atribacteria-1]
MTYTMIEEGMDILTAIQRRLSVRSYKDRPVSSALLERILGLASTADHLTSIPPRIKLISGVEQTKHILTSLIGSYGLVRNSPHLLVGVMPEESELSRIDLGYVLEQVVLKTVQLGLGTCWISGSFDAQRAGNVVGLAPGEVVAAVCALGHPSEDHRGRLHIRTMRWLAGGHRRKPLTEIIFSEHWGEPWSPNAADSTLITVLEHARLAPSGYNRQPWRFIIRSDDVLLTLILAKPGIVDRLYPLVNVEQHTRVRAKPIDAGIVMAHFALVFEAIGRTGQWELRLGDTALMKEYKLPQGVIPVATFKLKE